MGVPKVNGICLSVTGTAFAPKHPASISEAPETTPGAAQRLGLYFGIPAMVLASTVRTVPVVADDDTSFPPTGS